MKFSELIRKVNDYPAKSAWNKGVKEYALMLLEEAENGARYDNAEVMSENDIKKYALNGAQDWKEKSEGGGGLIYNNEIAKTLCSPWELKKVSDKFGNVVKDPNPRENWIDVQSRAMYQAWLMISGIISKNGGTVEL